MAVWDSRGWECFSCSSKSEKRSVAPKGTTRRWRSDPWKPWEVILFHVRVACLQTLKGAILYSRSSFLPGWVGRQGKITSHPLYSDNSEGSYKLCSGQEHELWIQVLSLDLWPQRNGLLRLSTLIVTTLGLLWGVHEIMLGKCSANYLAHSKHSNNSNTNKNNKNNSNCDAIIIVVAEVEMKANPVGVYSSILVLFPWRSYRKTFDPRPFTTIYLIFAMRKRDSTEWCGGNGIV